MPRRRAKSSDRDALEWESTKSQRERVEWEQKQEAHRRSRATDQRDLRYKRLTAVAAGLALLTSIGVGWFNYTTSQATLEAANANLEIAERTDPRPILGSITYFPYSYGRAEAPAFLLTYRNEGRTGTDITAFKMELAQLQPDGSCRGADIDKALLLRVLKRESVVFDPGVTLELPFTAFPEDLTTFDVSDCRGLRDTASIAFNIYSLQGSRCEIATGWRTITPNENNLEREIQGTLSGRFECSPS